GNRERVHPFALRMATAIGRAVENAIEARSLERQARLATAFADVTARHPGQPIVVVDASRRVLLATPSAQVAPRGVVPPALATLEEIVVHDAGQVVGICLILDGGARGATRRGPKRCSARGTPRYRMSDLLGSDPRLIEAKRIAEAAA